MLSIQRRKGCLRYDKAVTLYLSGPTFFETNVGSNSPLYLQAS